MREYDVLIIGGGVAGMTAACTLWNLYQQEKKKAVSILLAERDAALGGVLRQCMHEGFGEQNQSGPAYAEHLLQQLLQTDTTISTDTEVLEIQEMEEHVVVSMQNRDGVFTVCCRHVLLAAGCYERSYGNLFLHGDRPEGVFTAGELQRMINLEGYRPGKEAVVIGSGDIGLIIARRLVLNGSAVKRIVEIQDHCPALERNKQGCLIAHHLPLQRNARVVALHGTHRISKVTIEDLKTKQLEDISCDLLVTAAGLIPDQSLIDGMEDQKHITLLGNCERIYPSVEGIVHSVNEKCRQIIETLHLQDIS